MAAVAQRGDATVSFYADNQLIDDWVLEAPPNKTITKTWIETDLSYFFLKFQFKDISKTADLT
jgi:hypothetical protein